MPNYIAGEVDLLEGNGKVSYRIAEDECGLLYLKITKKTGPGSSSIEGKPVYFWKLLDRIGSVKGHFKLSVLKGAIPGANNNDPYVVGTVLRRIGFIERIDDGKWRRKTDKSACS